MTEKDRGSDCDDPGRRTVSRGITNAKQALSLSDGIDVSVSHPDRDSGRTEEFIDREELRTLAEPWMESVGIRFPAPISADAVDRSNEAKAATRTVLQEIVASASEAGWATR
ncbi:hypothetical protein RGCCGE502_21050 [Rhizobium grahamii CCGE 502]|uniref:Uncharacterized protein n=2 Tax=Rhizobium grahamii TaxID=1120045 RepID=S3HT40_9HYPH|nr:hypothetical protein RGCCGE502_21050 [Rhizobium grahamii CCGE 502]